MKLGDLELKVHVEQGALEEYAVEVVGDTEATCFIPSENGQVSVHDHTAR